MRLSLFFISCAVLVFVTGLSIGASHPLYAQESDNIFDEYSPPAMFGAPLTGLQEVEQEQLAPLTPTPLTPTPLTPTPSAPHNSGEYRKPQYRQNIPIISTDDILGRSLVGTQQAAKPQNLNRQSQATFKPFTPPLPLRRPERFSLSQDMIDQMRGGGGKMESGAAQGIEPRASTNTSAERRNITENQRIISFHEAHEGNLQIIEMDVRDVLHNINPREATLQPAIQKNIERVQGHVVVLSYESDEETSLSDQHIAQLDQVVLSYLQDAPENRIEISASSASPDIVQARRNALSRALAVRAYLEKNGITAQRAIIRARGHQTPETPAENLTSITLQ